MNPRYRRLLIPGLLVLLLVVVIVSSVGDRADGAAAEPQVVSRLTDPRITESSGLALSLAYDGMAYTINDSGNAPLIFAVDIATGRTVGTTRVEGGRLRDTEALAIDRDGTLWVADTGDNDEQRDDAALYALPEQGAGNHTVRAKRYPIVYGDLSPNVEALLVHPVTGAKYLVSKNVMGGTVYALPPTLSTERANAAVAQAVNGPPIVTDATFTRDGTYAVLRSYTSMFLIDPTDWSVINSVPTPQQKQGETITAEVDSLLIGSEGSGSELIRVPIPAVPVDQAPAPNPTNSADVSSASAGASDDETVAPLLFVLGALVTAGVLGAGVTVWARRSR